MHPAVVVLVEEYQHPIEGITSGQPHVKLPCTACMWHVLVMYSMNLHVNVAVDTCMDKNHLIANIVLMYQKSSSCVQRANLNSPRRLLNAPL